MNDKLAAVLDACKSAGVEAIDISDAVHHQYVCNSEGVWFARNLPVFVATLTAAKIEISSRGNTEISALSNALEQFKAQLALDAIVDERLKTLKALENK